MTNIPYNGTGGHTVTITHGDGYRTQYMHLSAFHVSDGTWVGQGAPSGSPVEPPEPRARAAPPARTSTGT